MSGVVIYSATCPKCRFVRKILGAINLKKGLKFLTWQKASERVLVEYYGSKEAVPYEYMFIDEEQNLYEGGSAIPLIMRSLWSG